ncbi:hypothetical protein RFI_27127 [Reticulomyxa filosa]|uniref:Uncharacterized protein n=1 Tax=Reticulomyxa filosa TaxID=46433 RepID=X6M8K8_RETFI|nr:hypothetical protein RFI_27127 [Reticulomyxa filosa]|eukprot:ETO10249.1 hypothetical protein RFI_27127 [Reticulomyxa filosa]
MICILLIWTCWWIIAKKKCYGLGKRKEPEREEEKGDDDTINVIRKEKQKTPKATPINTAISDDVRNTYVFSRPPKLRFAPPSQSSSVATPNDAALRHVYSPASLASQSEAKAKQLTPDNSRIANRFGISSYWFFFFDWFERHTMSGILTKERKGFVFFFDIKKKTTLEKAQTKGKNYP